MTEDHTSPHIHPHSSGLTVIIVGLGIAGLTAAIECHRRGHKVIGFERQPNCNQLGDIIGLSANSISVLSQWSSNFFEELTKGDITSNVKGVDVFDVNGNHKFRMPYNADSPEQGYLFRRSGLLIRLHEFATGLGIDMRFGVRVESYWETDHSAGILVNNERIIGDCVIAADGINSKARDNNIGTDVAPQDVGVVIYRAIFDASELSGVPEAQWILEGTSEVDTYEAYCGKGIFVLAGTAANGRYVYWSCTLRSSACGDAKVWLQPASMDPVLNHLETLPIGKRLLPVFARTPPAKCLNCKVSAWVPLARWVSDHGRTMLIGDAAHPFLPYTGQGGNQAIEDAAVLAICLQLSGKKNVPLALRVAEKLRHQRVSLIQKGAIEAKDSFLEPEWDSQDASERPTSYTQQAWVYKHDCVGDTYNEYSKVAEAIINGWDYVPKNVPRDGKYCQDQA